MSSARLVSRVIAGALLVNAVPHGVSGVQGRRFPSPLAHPPGRGLSAPTTNVIWSAANALAGAVLLRSGVHGRGERAAVAGGAVSMALLLAAWFGRVLDDSR
ncbi:hypothetical protein CLV46_0484 [Diaminobutyricimonas aerilata]|uniref:Uncharacterized protein n=1 Tax=Diaminobutyricimonas aerilata TaxID=1162967 RepID=A0A2M9CGH4_9MICO|nr:hypothetical protein [Diaminobutyricimonas aerilata]PJJ70952.1 hypothetical protein CLV46_0484 [Diaminobutyricimonas aerilata]